MLENLEEKFVTRYSLGRCTSNAMKFLKDGAWNPLTLLIK